MEGEVGYAPAPKRKGASTYISWNPSLRKICLFSLIYLFNLLFILDWNPVWFCFLFQVVSNSNVFLISQIVLPLAISSSFKLAPMSFGHASSFF